MHEFNYICLRILVESSFALPSPGLSLHFEESFPTERAVRLACPGRGVSEVFPWVKSGWCMYQAPRCFTSGCAIPMCRDVASPKMSGFFWDQKDVESPWLKQMLFREVTECGTDIAQLIHHASSQTILFNQQHLSKWEVQQLKGKKTHHGITCHQLSQLSPLTEILLKWHLGARLPNQRSPTGRKLRDRGGFEASILG